MADETLAAMAAASALSGSELMYCTQAGADSKVTPAQLLAYVEGAMVVGSGAIATSQASIGTSAALIVAARTGAAGTGRIAATLYNEGTVTVFFGPSGVTTSTGMPLPAGASATINTTAAIYGISTIASQTIGVMETF